MILDVQCWIKMEATSVYIKKEIEDAEYERSYHYSADDTLLNQVAHEEDYTVTVNPEAVLDIKYERGEGYFAMCFTYFNYVIQ
jgi:hypothetical protein